MSLFEFLNQLDEASLAYHFDVENQGSSLTLNLELDSNSGFFSRYDVKVRLTPNGSWEVFDLPDDDITALIQAYELAERHGTRTRGSVDYIFTLEDLVELIADVPDRRK
jgi:hypothetical protein